SRCRFGSPRPTPTCFAQLRTSITTTYTATSSTTTTAFATPPDTRGATTRPGEEPARTAVLPARRRAYPRGHGRRRGLLPSRRPRKRRARARRTRSASLATERRHCPAVASRTWSELKPKVAVRWGRETLSARRWLRGRARVERPSAALARAGAKPAWIGRAPWVAHLARARDQEPPELTPGSLRERGAQPRRVRTAERPRALAAAWLHEPAQDAPRRRAPAPRGTARELRHAGRRTQGPASRRSVVTA